MAITDLISQIYGTNVGEIRQRYEESLAAPSQLNITAPKIETGEITGLLDQIIQRYKVGGEFGKAELSLLKRAKTKSLASTAQGLVSAGLAGTTAGVAAGRKWEEEIGMPSRLRLEDIRTERLTQAMGAKAGFMERATTAEAQFALAKAQLQLQEKLQNRQISLQEYLAEMDRLGKMSVSGRAVPYAPTAGRGGAGAGGGAGGGTGAGFGGMGAGYGDSGGIGPGHGQPGPGWTFSPPTGEEGGPGTPLGTWEPPPGAGPAAPQPGDIKFPAGGREPERVNVGIPGYPSWVQQSMMPNLLGIGQRLAG